MTVNKETVRLNKLCTNLHSEPGSIEWAILYLLYFLNVAAAIELTVFNVISYMVFRARILKRSEARSLQMFGVLCLCDLLITYTLTLRDCIYVWGECQSNGVRVMQLKLTLRCSDGAFFIWRALLSLMIVSYYLCVYLSPYQSEKIALRVNTIAAFALGVACVFGVIDFFSVKIFPCSK